MFKKSLVAVALVGAVGMAQAGNVQVYGVVDAGVAYQHHNTKMVINNLGTKANESFTVENKDKSFKLASGKHSGNRFGIKGTEDIADNLKAGFVLESGFDLLNGDMAEKGKLFNRQADLFIEGDFGHLAFGRVGTLTSANGTYGIFGNLTDNFAGGWGDDIGSSKHAFVSSGRIDNSITYVSPELAGAKIYAQYSFNQKGEQQDKLRENDRYAAIGATYNLDKLQLVGVFDKTFYNNNQLNYVGLSKPKESKISDRWSLNLGGSYDFDLVKVYLAYQHADHAKDFGIATSHELVRQMKKSDIVNTAKNEKKFVQAIQLMPIDMKFSDEAYTDAVLNHANGFKTNTISLGADAPVGNGVVKAQVTYGEAKTHHRYVGGTIAASAKMHTFGVALGYEHNLSKRTQLYVGTAYARDKFDIKVNPDKKKSFAYPIKIRYSNFEAVAGLVHKF